MSPAKTKRPPRWMTVGLPIVLLAAGAAVAALLLSTRPSAGKGKKAEAAPLLVQTLTAQPRTAAMIVEVMGTVVPAHEVELKARVGGHVTALSESFSPGGLLRAGQTAVTLDDTDYQLTLRQAENTLARAMADLDLEMGQQRVAREQFAMLDGMGGNEAADQSSLALRGPQLAQAQADVDDAEADLSQARLDLDRTRVKVPFNALVTARSVAPGSEVTTSTALGTLVDVDEYWVEAAVPVARLRNMRFAARDGQGSPVAISGRAGAATRQGSLLASVGELVESSRLARVLIRVPDPLGLSTGGTPLVLNEYVSARITGPEVEGVYVLPRSALREGDQVWVAEGATLDIREVEVGWSDAENAYLTDGLAPGDRVVTSGIPTPVQGMTLRVDAANDAPAADTGKEASHEG